MLLSISDTTSRLIAETPKITCVTAWTPITFDFANQATLVTIGDHSININFKLENVHRLRFGPRTNLPESLRGCVSHLKINRESVSLSNNDLFSLEGSAEFKNCPFV